MPYEAPKPQGYIASAPYSWQLVSAAAREGGGEGGERGYSAGVARGRGGWPDTAAPQLASVLPLCKNSHKSARTLAHVPGTTTYSYKVV
jgi:hypothetical protein